MAILFSGDFHANSVNELSAITKKNLINKYGQETYNDIRYQIILGDGGFMWPDNQKADRFNYKSLACRPFPVLCVIGNHEPILGMIENMRETDIDLGESVYQIQDKPFVAYLKRGKAYSIDGFKFLVLGGALSIDKMYRKPGKSWWKEEYWSEKEKLDVLKLLETEKKFDCVISHTGPHHINNKLFMHGDFDPDKFIDEVAIMNDQIHKKIQFKKWWCGHWHHDIYHYDRNSGREYQYLYRTTKILDKVDNQMMVYDEYGMSKADCPLS